MAYQAVTEQPSYPHNAAAERTVLSAIMKDTGMIYQLGIDQTDFFDTRNKLIFCAVRDLSKTEQKCTVADIIDNIKSVKEISKAGGEGYIGGIHTEYHTAEYVQRGFKFIRDEATSRAAIDFARELIANASAKKTSEELIAHVNGTIGRVFKETAKKQEPAGSFTMSDFKKRLQEAKDGVTSKKLIFGLGPLDAMFDGQVTCSTNYIVLGATPSTGKTALTGQCFLTLLEQGHKVFFASQEMKAKDLVARMVAFHSGVNVTNINKASLFNKYEEDKVMASYEYVTNLIDQHGEIYDDSKMTAELIQAKAMAFKRKHGSLAVIMVDYLQRIKQPTSVKKNMQTNEIIAENSIMFKDMSKDLDCVLFVLSQLTLKDGEDKPDLEHLRGSKDIGQDADIVILLSRAENRRETEGCDIINVNVAKGRNIGIGEFQAKFFSRFMRFEGMNEYRQPNTGLSEDEYRDL